MSTGADPTWPAFAAEALACCDPRLEPELRAGLLERARRGTPPGLPRGRVVLVGHRASGKSRLLPVLAARLGWPALDLDAELERRAGRPLARWVADDEPSFRAAERTTFAALRGPRLVAVGGGFLALHADLLAGDTAVLVPVTFDTYCERLRADHTRPRLRPELPLEDELRAVWQEREAAHGRVATVPLVDLLWGAQANVEEARACTAS